MVDLTTRKFTGFSGRSAPSRVMLDRMNPWRQTDGLETVWRNAACAVASGFTTYTVAMWFETGRPEPLFLLACALVWVLVSTAFLPRSSAH